MELNKKALFNENGDIELSKRKMIKITSIILWLSISMKWKNPKG